MDRDNDFIHAWPTGFMLIQGNRLESLRGLMTTWMQRHPLHPLENEIILVQSNGIGQWLKLALAAPRAHDSASDDSAGDHLGGGCGIAAALDLMLPSRFLWQAYRAVLGDLPETSAYDKAPLAWRLYRLLGDLDALAEDDEEARWLDPLRGFLAVDGDARRRQQLAERLADLYDQYQVYRADWLSAWQQSDDVLPGPVGAGRPLPDGQRWQPLLWRLLKANIAGAGVDAASGQPHTESSRAEIHQRFLRQASTLTWSTRPQELPRRVIVFGISSLPRQAIEVLEAIAPVAQVMLFVQNPSQHYWGDLVEGRELFRRAYRRNAAREKVPDGLDENALHLHGHPLLAAWGKQGRDYIRLLDEHDDRSRYEAHFADQRLQIDLFESPGAETLLQQLQDDILELRPLHERREQATAIDPAQDRSLEFLIAHSPQREVEILHDQLLDAFAAAEHAGTPLPPRDILVMVPDIATYAPHIEAVFGRLSSDDPRRIPFQIADQGKRQRDPLLIGFEVLLNLPQARFAVSELLDLLEIPALRARFRLDEAQLPLLRQWIEGANIRWGLDAEQRAGLDLPQGLEQNSWRFGLKRMLLGFATGDSGPWQGIEPFDEIGGLDAALVGPLMQLLETLSESWALLQQPRRPADWNALLAERLDALFRADSETDELALSEIRQALEQWLLDATRGGAEGEPLPLEVVRDTLLVGLDAPTLSQRFLVGAVNFATLMPMRAIPFRQIWLLGMNDGDYPRSRRPADFDLMANDYRPGDRSRREDDRYLFLEALLAARERLVISWVGRSIRDDSERPPSVLVGQLRDHIKAGWQLAPAAAAVVTQCAGEANVPSTDTGTDQKASPDTSRAALVAALTTTHPLQPFSRRYFEETGDPRLFTYAREWRDLHRPLAQAPTAIPERPPQLSAPTFDGPINLITLGRFLRYPVPTFYTQRLSLYLGQEAEQQDDEEPFDVDALTSWGLRAAIVESIEQQLVAQPDIASELCLQSAVERLARAGELPLPPFDVDWCADLQAQLSAPFWRYRELLEAYCEPQAISSFGFEAAGLVLEDSLSGLRADAGGNRLQLRLQPSVLVKKQELSWHHLVRHWPGHLAAQCDGPTSTCLLGPASEVWLRPLRRDQAEHQLSELMEGYVQGLSQPLPLACKTAFAELRATAGESGANPAQTFEGSDYYRGECDEHVGYQRFWPDYAALSAAADYLALIHRLYGPLYQHAHESKEI